jgi:hypothetical protein
LLALRKQLLLARSKLCRLQIRQELDDVQATLKRPTRLLTLAARTLLVGKVALGAFKLLRRA